MNAKKIKFIAIICLIMGVMLYLNGCFQTSKTNMNNPFASPSPDPNKVYVAGYCIHSGDQTACYWENMSRYDLTDGYEANSIVMIGQTLYIRLRRPTPVSSRANAA